MIETKRMNISEAVPKDIDEIIAIEKHKENRDFLWIGTKKEHESEIKDPNHLLLIFRKKEDGRTVGYALIRLDKKSEIFELRRIAITEKNKGFGREAMEALLKEAFENMDINRFWLDVYPDNTIGIKLYESMGMRRDGTLRRNYRSDRGYLDQIIYSMLKEEYFRRKLNKNDGGENMDKRRWETSARRVINGYLNRNDGCFDAEMRGRLTDCDYERQKVSIEFETLKWQLNERGGIHGGAIAGMFDTALGITANFIAGTAQEQNWEQKGPERSDFSAERSGEAATAEMNISYMRPLALGQRAVVDVYIVKAGRTAIRLRGEMLCRENGKLVAAASGLWIPL